MGNGSEGASGNPLALDEVRMIGGQPYRFGFLNAFWGNFDHEDPQTKRRGRRENVLLLSCDLYHYTSLAGFKGIVEENGFWISDNRFMNDTEETRHGIHLAQEVLQHKIKRLRDPAFADILRTVERTISESSEYGQLVACFSTVRDDLGQWRGYGAGGVCIHLGQQVDGDAPLFFGPDHVPYKAIYDDSRKKVLLLSMIRAFEHEYALDRAAMPVSWPDDHDEEYAKQLQLRISSGILGFKDRSFRSEAEARLVIPYKAANRYDGGLRFRVSKLGIIPYLRTGDHLAAKKNGGRLPIREVVVGPAPHQDLVAQSVETFLRHKGYAETSVNLSKVPYRAP